MIHCDTSLRKIWDQKDSRNRSGSVYVYIYIYSIVKPSEVEIV